MVIALASGCGPLSGSREAAPPVAYPSTFRSDHADDYHGTRVADPYRWLEKISGPAALDWIDAQNAVTLPRLAGLPARTDFASRMRALIDFERYGIPQARGGRYAYTYNPGRLDQDQLWIGDAPAGPGKLIVDPNLLSADGTVSLGDFELSPDGAWLAYSLSDGGSDWRTWYVVDAATGRQLEDRLVGIKFSGVSWRPDSTGFFYSRYPATGDGASFDDTRQVSVWYHVLGTAQDDDEPVFAVTDHPTRNPYAKISDDGRYLVVSLFDGYETNGVYLVPMHRGRPDGAPVRLLDDWDARYEYLGNVADRFYFQTTNGALLGRIIEIDLDRPLPAHWRTVVAEQPQALAGSSMVGGRLIARYIIDARARVRRFSLRGDDLGDIVLPGDGTVDGFAGAAGSPETFFSYTDFTTPPSVYRLDSLTGDTDVVRASVPGAGLRSEQIFFASRDGTQVPMTIVRRADAPAGVPLPTVLYGYGGFNVSLLPRYSVSRMAWLQAGGAYAVANLRGGGEYGEAWHRAGTKLNKQNVFDDFVAAAEWLVAQSYTTPGQLAIWGGSNGGLLVGAVMIQRPDLFAAAVPAVGVLDMLRYHTSSANARQWSSDYGLSENPAEFRALYAYSPVHNLSPGTCYPATLIMADANDDRVAPWHSYKFAAALQHAQGCARPVLIRIETRTGHGGGASTSKIIDEYADQWAFVAEHVGLN